MEQAGIDLGHGIRKDWFDEMVLELYPFHIRSLLERVTGEPDPSTRKVEASVDEWGKSAAEYADYLREVGLDAGMHDAVHRLLGAASQAGHGDADWTRLAGHSATSSHRRPRR